MITNRRRYLLQCFAEESEATDELNNLVESNAGILKPHKPKQPSVAVEREMSLHEALAYYAQAGEVEEFDSLLNQLRAIVRENPNNQDAPAYLAEGLYLALKGCKQEIWRDRHNALLHEMRQLLERYHNDPNVKRFLASALLDFMELHQDEYYHYNPEPSFRLQDDTLSELRALVERYPNETSLQKVFCKAFRTAIRFSAAVKQNDRCESLLNEFENEPTLAQYHKHPRYRVESIADVFGCCSHDENTGGVRALVQRLQKIAENLSSRLATTGVV